MPSEHVQKMTVGLNEDSVASVNIKAELVPTALKDKAIQGFLFIVSELTVTVHISLYCCMSKEGCWFSYPEIPFLCEDLPLKSQLWKCKA